MSADSIHRLVTNLQHEVTFFECPLAVGTYKSETLSRQLEGNGLHLTGLQFNLRKVAQTLVVRHDRSHKVT